MKLKIVLAASALIAFSAAFAGCGAKNNAEIPENQLQTVIPEEPAEIPEERIESPEISLPEEIPEPPEIKKASYIKVTGDSVNIRSGAGTSYSVSGTAEKSTLYTCLGEENGWYKTKYKNRTVYISKQYCTKVELETDDNELIERVISEGCKLLGVPYVYGAVRLHDGKGNMLKGFSENAFDCSSLMQYIFYKGAGKLLDVNTRTQIYQGTTISKSNLKRGDLIFFTNDSRKNNKGIERVGHVALYLGDNYILHTASDYAKIEQISSKRWSYYIQAQRII